MFVTPNWIAEAFNVLKDLRLGNLPFLSILFLIFHSSSYIITIQPPRFHISFLFGSCWGLKGFLCTIG
jgi:hypothetical protein